MSACTEKCQHIGPDGGWDHEARLEEDRGEIHTDDCGFFHCRHDHDPGECCTAGQPGVVCRVPRRSPPGGTPNRPTKCLHGDRWHYSDTPCGGAASRSEQSAGRCVVCGVAAAYRADAKDYCGAHGPAAAEAAQSPQVGAEMDEDGCCVVCGRGLEPCYACAEPGREGSDRPPVNPPVASADPELAKLLREAHDLLRIWPSDAGWRPDPGLMRRIDSALSRLAGRNP